MELEINEYNYSFKNRCRRKHIIAADFQLTGGCHIHHPTFNIQRAAAAAAVIWKWKVLIIFHLARAYRFYYKKFIVKRSRGTFPKICFPDIIRSYKFFIDFLFSNARWENNKNDLDVYHICKNSNLYFHAFNHISFLFHLVVLSFHIEAEKKTVI